MATKSKRRMVRAFWEVPVKGRTDPAIVSREEVIGSIEHMDAVEADLRKRLLSIVEDAAGLHLDHTRRWWMNVAAAARAKPGTTVG